MVVTKTSVDSKRERDILSHSIANTEFLKAMVTVCKEQYLVSPHSRVVWRWCAEYFAQYSKAPGKDIQDIYIMHRSGMKADDADNVGTMLSSLSDDFMEVSNIQYLTKVSIDYLRERSLDVHIEAIKQCKDRRDLVEAEKLIAEYGRVTGVIAKSLDVMGNHEAVHAAFNVDESETLFTFDNALGALCGPINRADLFAITAYKKRSKTFILIEAAVRAMMHGRRVLFVSFEMTNESMLRRIWGRLMVEPRHTRITKIPYFYKDTEDFDEKWKIAWEDHQITKSAPTMEEIQGFYEQFKKYYPTSDLRLLSYPSKSLTVSDLKNKVDSMSFYEEFSPDLIVIDYASLFKHPGEDLRIGIGETWAKMRGWAMEANIGIVTASQANRSSASSSVVHENMVAESDEIISHVTCMIGVTATKQEMELGLYRFQQMASREEAVISDTVVGLSCLDIGQHMYDSRFLSEIDYEFLKEVKEQ